jgi:putative ABC transport system permease protein
MEIGLRMALGARPRDVVWLSLKRGLIVTAIGLATGLIATGLTTRLIASLLFDVKPSDPMTYVIVVGLLGFASLAAICIPARKSAEVDPLVALRYE